MLTYLIILKTTDKITDIVYLSTFIYRQFITPRRLLPSNRQYLIAAPLILLYIWVRIKIKSDGNFNRKHK
jgi:hypothetical protein